MRDHLNTPCIEWEKCRLPSGYGRTNMNGRHVYAHRLAYCEANGLSLDDISELVVRHKCDNPPCVNPDHLEIGTQADNVHDRQVRGRHRIAPVRGEAAGMSKLTDLQAEEIRRAFFSGETQRLIASRYGITQSSVSRIVAGRTWAHAGSPALEKSSRPRINSQAKLTPEKVEEIRRRRAAGEGRKSLAGEFGVSPKTVTNICLNKSWVQEA